MMSYSSFKATDRLLTILPPGSRNSPLHCKATVTTDICPYRIGQVKFLGTWWSALCEQDVVLLTGSIVYVVDRENLTLIVEPAALFTST